MSILITLSDYYIESDTASNNIHRKGGGGGLTKQQ